MYKMPRRRCFYYPLGIVILLIVSGCCCAFSSSAPLSPNTRWRRFTALPFEAAASDSESNKSKASNLTVSEHSPDNASSDNAEGSSTILQDLENELEELKRELEVQRDTYNQQLEVLKEESRMQSSKAESALKQLNDEYKEYQKHVKTQLEQTPAASEVKTMETALSDLRQRATTQETHLELAKTQLLTNREARKQLQAEMVALKHTYLSRLAELEDALESEQDGRVRDQQWQKKELNQVMENYQQKLAATINESKQHAEQLSADFEAKLQLRHEEIVSLQEYLKQVEAAVGERELRIAVLEEEQSSLRKVTRQWLRLVRQKIASRLSRSKRQRNP